MRSATEEFILSPPSPEWESKNFSARNVLGDRSGSATTTTAVMVGRKSCSARCLDKFIHARCTNKALGGTSFLFGILALLLQSVSLASDHWLCTIEPREVNLTDENNEKKSELFKFNSGYWRVCWNHYYDPARNLSIISPQEMDYFKSSEFFQRQCLVYLHTDNQTDEILTITRATGAILNRIMLSAVLHLLSLLVTAIGLFFAIQGRLRQNLRTFYSAILYIISGILMSVAVLQYVCVVDDEMGTKMKKTPEGDDPPYKFDYAWSFIAASLSFLCIEGSALIELLLFLRRYPTLEDKMKIVPGLQDKVQRAVLNHEFDDIVPTRVGSRRNSPRISVSFHDTGSDIA